MVCVCVCERGEGGDGGVCAIIRVSSIYRSVCACVCVCVCVCAREERVVMVVFVQ